MLSARTRVTQALEHKEPDRVPINYVGVPETNARLRQHFGLQTDEELLDRLGVDLRPIFPTYIGPSHKVGYTTVLAPGEDIFGVRRRAVRNPYGEYYETQYSPLAGATTLAEVDAYPWPTVDWFNWESLVPQIERINCRHEYYITIFGGCVFENAYPMRGFEQFLLDLAEQPELADRIMQKIADFGCEFIECALEAGQGQIDMVRLSDDVGGQSGMLVSPRMWREMFHPHLERLIKTAKSQGVKVRYHSCGCIDPIIPDLVDLGADVLNPLQFSAMRITPTELKERYGALLSFDGGLDTQHTLPHGTPEQVRAEAQMLIDVLGAGGGYILNSCHNIQPDVPVENILALYETGLTHRYGANP